MYLCHSSDDARARVDAGDGSVPDHVQALLNLESIFLHQFWKNNNGPKEGPNYINKWGFYCILVLLCKCLKFI
jgi:hypothetical protein